MCVYGFHAVSELKLFVASCKDRIDGATNEDTFVAVYRQWYRSEYRVRGTGLFSITLDDATLTLSSPTFYPLLQDIAMHPVVTEGDLANVLVELDITDHNLNVIAALLANERNRSLIAATRDAAKAISADWIAACERLFFALDSSGTGHIAIDGKRGSQTG